MTAPRVLIVDDDRDFAESLAEALETLGCQADARFTGEAGIEAVSNQVFDAVLMDVGLPGLGGVESLTRIRRANPHAKCFLLTGYSADHVAGQVVEAGAVEVLTKPIDVEQLLRRLKTNGQD